MSAYVVKDQTISRVVSIIRRDLEAPKFNRQHCRATARILDKWNLPTDPNILGQQMLSLNIRAVNARYDEDSPLERFEFAETHGTSRLQGYKSLQCWLYQCSEGDIPETGLFQAFTELGRVWAEEIVSGLPEYDRAEWG